MIRDELEAAWVCGFPYVLYKSKFDLCVLPLYHGAPLYQSYLIVPDGDKTTSHIRDLANSVFAFSDPQSNSGYLVPRAELARIDTVPEAFFKKFFFTFGHRKVIDAAEQTGRPLPIRGLPRCPLHHQGEQDNDASLALLMERHIHLFGFA